MPATPCVLQGLFGDRQANRSGSREEQQDFLLAKLNATVEWAKADPDVVGIIPCKPSATDPILSSGLCARVT